MSTLSNYAYFQMLSQWFSEHVERPFKEDRREKTLPEPLQTQYLQMKQILTAYDSYTLTETEELDLLTHFQILANLFYRTLYQVVSRGQLHMTLEPPQVFTSFTTAIKDPVESSSQLLESLKEKDKLDTEYRQAMYGATTSTPPPRDTTPPKATPTYDPEITKQERLLKATPTYDPEITKQERLLLAIPKASHDIEKVRDALRRAYPEKIIEYNTLSAKDLIKYVLLKIHPDKVHESMRELASEATKSILALKLTLDESHFFSASTYPSSTPPSPTTPPASRGDTFKDSESTKSSRPYTPSYSDAGGTSRAPTPAQSEPWQGPRWSDLDSRSRTKLTELHTSLVKSSLPIERQPHLASSFFGIIRASGKVLKGRELFKDNQWIVKEHFGVAPKAKPSGGPGR